MPISWNQTNILHIFHKKVSKNSNLNQSTWHWHGFSPQAVPLCLSWAGYFVLGRLATLFGLHQLENCHSFGTNLLVSSGRKAGVSAYFEVRNTKKLSFITLKCDCWATQNCAVCIVARSHLGFPTNLRKKFCKKNRKILRSHFSIFGGFVGNILLLYQIHY